MAIILQVLEGEIAEEAKPLFATRDPRILQLVIHELSLRVGGRTLPNPLRFINRKSDPPEEEE